MKKRKTNINFLASQKVIAKQNQSTSFEFILVSVVILLVIVMGALFYLSIINNQNAEIEIAKYENQLGDIKKETELKMKKFASYQKATDENGQEIILESEIDKNGNLVYKYKWYSIKDVAESLANELDEINKASKQAQLQIDLTSTVMLIIFSEADKLDCDIVTMNFNNRKMSVTVLGPTEYAWGQFKDALSKNTNTATGFDNTLYIDDIGGTHVEYDKTCDKYRFTVSFSIIADSHYFVEEDN